MADEKVSRREFITKTSMAASTVVAGAAVGDAGAQEAEEYVQSDYAVRTKALAWARTLSKSTQGDQNKGRTAFCRNCGSTLISIRTLSDQEDFLVDPVL
jgi:hypothetical protein